VYAILRAAFMSDEPVRGAPSIDAFSVEKVENETWRSTLSFSLSLLLFPVSLSVSLPVSPWLFPIFPLVLISFHLAYPPCRWTTAFAGGTRCSLTAGDSICARVT